MEGQQSPISQRIAEETNSRIHVLHSLIKKRTRDEDYLGRPPPPPEEANGGNAAGKQKDECQVQWGVG